uniref:Transcription initiation factor IIB n=1 Tax=Panagrolaimus sp. PS1159 TaxID=55785 RepID=A0AC35FJ45_9BILA
MASLASSGELSEEDTEDRLIDDGAEWRPFNNEQNRADPSRVGAADIENLTSKFGNLSTGIRISYQTSGNNKELLKAHARNSEPSNKRLYAAVELIRDISERLNATEAIENSAIQSYKKILDEKTKVSRKRNVEARAASCIYFACRKQNVPRSYEEIAAVSNLTKRMIREYVEQLCIDLNTHFADLNGSEFISRFCGNLNLDFSIESAATRITQKADELNLVTGRKPIAIAGAAIYMASRASEDKPAIKEICEITGASEYAIRQSYKLLLPHAKELFPENFKFYSPLKSLPKR